MSQDRPTTIGIDRTDHGRFAAIAKAEGLHHAQLFRRMLTLWEATPVVERETVLHDARMAALAAQTKEQTE